MPSKSKQPKDEAAERSHVDFVNTERDKEILRLAGLGRPMFYIAIATNTTVSQVAYRLRKGGDFKLRAIRSGNDRHGFLSQVERTEAFRKLSDQWVDRVLAEQGVVKNNQMVSKKVRKVEPHQQGRVESNRPHRAMAAAAAR